MRITPTLGRVAITGGSGLLGANLAFELSCHGGQAIALYKDHPLTLPGGQPAVSCDLTDPSQTARWVQDWEPEWIVHAAALTDVDWCESHPAETFRVNVEAARNIALAAKQAGARLVYISTDAVFNGERGYYWENDPPSPINVYGRSKLLGEVAVAEHVPNCLIVRTNIYGWNMQPKLTLAEWMFTRLEAGQLVPGFQDVFFSPILVNDLCYYLLAMMELGLEGLYHVASSQSASKYDFAICLAETFGFDRGLVRASCLAAAHLPAPRPPNASLRTNKVSRVLGAAMPDVRSGLDRFKQLREDGWARQLKALPGGVTSARV